MLAFVLVIVIMAAMVRYHVVVIDLVIDLVVHLHMNMLPLLSLRL